MDTTALHRQNGAWLAPREQLVLRWLAERLPGPVTPDWLTAIGVFGALVATVGYGLAATHLEMLWLASFGIVVNWFGDSLDGTVARLRRIERPQYGFFLDNGIDLVAQALFAVGLGFSGLIRWDLAMAGLAGFFMVSMLALLQAEASRVFDIAYFGIGLTEIRCVLVAFNTVLFAFPPRPFEISGWSLTYPNLMAGLWIVVNAVIFFAVLIAEVQRLAALDPPRHPPLSSRPKDRQP